MSLLRAPASRPVPAQAFETQPLVNGGGSHDFDSASSSGASSSGSSGASRIVMSVLLALVIIGVAVVAIVALVRTYGSITVTNLQVCGTLDLSCVDSVVPQPWFVPQPGPIIFKRDVKGVKGRKNHGARTPSFDYEAPPFGPTSIILGNAASSINVKFPSRMLGHEAQTYHIFSNTSFAHTVSMTDSFNAADALDRCPSPTFSTAAFDRERLYNTIRFDGAPGSYVVFRVVDCGSIMLLSTRGVDVCTEDLTVCVNPIIDDFTVGNAVVSETLSAGTVDLGNLTVSGSATIANATIPILHSTTATITTANIVTATITTLTSTTATITTATINALTAATATIINLTTTTLSAVTATIATLTVTTLTALSATITTLVATTATIATAVITTLTAVNATVTNLNVTTHATISSLSVTGPFELPYPDTVAVWVDAGVAGDDVLNDGLSQGSPVKTIQRALTVLERFRGKKAAIELDGTTTHDFGANTTLDFFPLISMYGTVVIRGRRTNITHAEVLQVNVSTSGHRFVSVGTNFTDANPGGNTYQKHFVQASDETCFIVESQTTLGDFHLVGGNYHGALNPETWAVGQTFVAFRTATTVSWSGALTLVASFSRVTFEAIEFIPVDATSQFVAPAYRDDALVMRACRFTNIQNVASFDVPIIRTGETGLYPPVLDKRAVLRGSIVMNGGYIEGAVTNAAFTTQQLDTKTVLYSVWMKNVHMACVSMCNILGMISENPQETSVFVEASQFYLQGFKAYGTCSSANCVPIHVADATTFDIANINIAFAGAGLGGMFFSSHSTGQLSTIDITLNLAPYAIRFGENIVVRVSNATLTAQYPISTRTTCRVSLVNYQEYFPVGTLTPALFFERNDRVWFVGNGPWLIHWNTSNVAPIYFGHATVEMIGGGGMHCVSNPAVPCITADVMTDIHILANFTNENGVTPNNVIQVGANPVGPLNTQTDYATVGTKLCKLLVG